MVSYTHVDGRLPQQEGSGPLRLPSEPPGPPGDSALERALRHGRLGHALALLGVLLCAPSLVIGWHLDDHMHRYMLSDLPGASELLEAYESPFGIANGEPASVAWQVEQGYAPWWTDGELLVSLWRPLSELTHRLDALLFFDQPWLMHLHSLLWFGALLWVTTRLYRAVFGATTIAGLAAVLYALDHTHGFAVGWVANRNAIIAAFFAVGALRQFHQTSNHLSQPRAVATLALLAAALLSGEGSVAIIGYMVSHVVFLQDDTLRRRILRLLPPVALVVVWRVVYQLLGRGAEGSGLYLDPIREPLRFAAAAVERAPVLLLGELGLPPAEAYVFLPYQSQHYMLALVATLAFALLCWPLLRADATARFWAGGMLLSLLPACATHPNNRLLFFAGLGAMGLLSQLWHGYVGGAQWLPASGVLRRLGYGLTAVIAGFHLLISPLLLPVMACSVAVTAPLEVAVRELIDTPGIEQRDLIVIDSPDYYAAKLVRPLAATSGRGAPRRLRVLSTGAVALGVARTGESEVTVEYRGGALQGATDWLYSHPQTPMAVGERRQLEGMTLELLEVTADGRPQRVRFRFDSPLDAERLHWVRWRDDRFEPFEWSDVGDRFEQPPARVPLGIAF